MEVKWSINQPIKTAAIASVGFILRLLVTTRRVEFVTPINNWKRVNEAIHLWNSGLDPYLGGRFHEYPISLQFYKIIIAFCKIEYAFAATDILTAILLQQAIYNQLILNNEDSSKAKSKSSRVLFLHLLSPINILSCSSLSTSIFTNFLIAVIYYVLPMKPFRALTCVLCGFLACNNIHFSALVLPIFLCMEYCSYRQRHDRGRSYYRNGGFLSSLSSATLIFIATLLTLISTSYILMGNSWTFVKSTYLSILQVQDLTPNIGMFWYFFTEMFDQFLTFFRWVVQINSFIHVVPISIYLRDNPFYALYTVLVTSTILQPYPSICNVGLIASLLPQWSGYLEHMKHGLKITSTMITCACLWPIFWHLWVTSGTANANFYFGSTIAFGVAGVLFTWDLFHAHISLTAKQKSIEESKKDK